MTRSTLVRFATFTAVSVFLTWWIAGEIEGRSPGDAIDIHARFDDVSGIVEGDDVRLAGIPVGRVADVGAGALDGARSPDTLRAGHWRRAGCIRLLFE